MNTKSSDIFCVCLLCMLIAFKDVLSNTCTEQLNLYKNLKCTPIYDSAHSTVCPSEFDCSHLRDSNTKTQCYFDGVWYPIDDYITVTKSCDVHLCKCTQSLNFECSSKICPFIELPNVDSCYLSYESNKCCPTSFHCLSDWRSLSTCKVANTIYLEGELFNSPLDECKVCVCSKDFDKNFVSKDCTSKPCQVELYQSNDLINFCAPVYTSATDCCPTDFQCPNANDKKALENHGGDINDLKCNYGGVNVKLGIELTRTDVDFGFTTITVCRCKIPPYFTCYRKFI